MLTNLDWISKGQKFPPECEEERVKACEKYENLFDGKYDKVYGPDYKVRAEQLKLKDVDVKTLIQFPQLLSKKTADFVCSEPVRVDIKNNVDEITKLLSRINFNGSLYEGMLDVSRYGCAIIKILEDRLSLVPPKNWFPIVDAFDKKYIVQHVLAARVDKQIHVEIHNKGSYQKFIYAAELDQTNKKDVVFGDLIEKSEIVSTNIEDFAVQYLSNTTTSSNLFGMSDYKIIDSVLEELLWRLFSMSSILDKHSAPSMSGPKSMLETDPVSGRSYLRTGNYFAIDSTDLPRPEYLTWDGNLNAVQWQIDYLQNQLYTLSEMGAAFLEGAGKGEANSGRALRLRMTSPLVKAQRITNNNDATVKKIISIISAVHGYQIPIEDIALTWQDGLPNDLFDEAEVYEKATGGKPFMSQLEAVKRFNDMNDSNAEIELANIETEIE